MKVVDILNLKPHVEKLAEKEMDIDSAVTLAKTLRQIVVVANAFEQKRLVLVKEFGEAKEDGSMEVVDEEKKGLFQKALEQVLIEDKEIDKVNSGLLSVTVTPLEVINILPIFV